MNLKNVWNVGFEFYRKNMKSLAWWMQVLSPIIMMALIFGIGYIFGGSEDTNEQESATVAYITEQPVMRELMQNVEKDTNLDIVSFMSSSVTPKEYVEIGTLEDAQAKLDEGEIIGYLDFTEEPYVFYKDKESNVTINDVAYTIQNYNKGQVYEDVSLTNEQREIISQAYYPIDTKNVTVSKTSVEESIEQAEEEGSFSYGISFVVTIVIFFISVIYAGIVVQEVAVERGTKIIEIVLSSVSPMDHMYGKVLGAMLLVATHGVIYLVFAVISLRLAISRIGMPFIENIIGGTIREFLESNIPQISFGILYLILSILLFVILAVLLGSHANEPTDAQKLTGPVVMLALVGYYVGLFSEVIPVGLLRVLTLIPVVTPYSAPFILSKNFTWLAAWGYTSVLVIGVVVLLIVAQRYYKQNILVYGNRSWINRIFTP